MTVKQDFILIYDIFPITTFVFHATGAFAATQNAAKFSFYFHVMFVCFT